MSSAIERIDLAEVDFFYHSPHAFVDYTAMQSFSLIKSTVDILVYYGITDFTPHDIRELFEHINIVTKKSGRVFLPSPKKISGVLDIFLKPGKESLSLNDGVYHVNNWNGSGYGFEIENAHKCGWL